MSKPDFREDAEAHWKYTKKVIDAVMEVAHVAYVEGMIHGRKHGLEDKEE